MSDTNDAVDPQVEAVMQEPASRITTERISDDQKLFLKVLENLKHAVTKPDVETKVTKQLPSSDKLSDLCVAVAPFSEKVIKQKDPDEPGTTNVTISDKTKSLIVQKLAVTAEKNTGSDNRDDTVNSQIPLTVDKEIGLSGDGGNEIVPVAIYTAKDYSALNAVKKQEQSGSRQASPSVQLYSCKFCRYFSDNKNYLKQHIDLVHTSGRPYKCPYCEYAGKRSHALREHLIVHSDERPFQCPVCSATFRKKGHLTNHVKLHNSKRLVKCPLCKALVYDTGENGLDAHLKNDHDTERLYGCDLCEHIAANEPDIIKHLRQTHKTNIVSYKCDKCPYETANTVEFQAHKTAHAMTDGKVQIGDQTPTKVLGVATLSSERDAVHLGEPNTLVKMKTSDNNSNTKQPAVIKPVWIKCSECGFTGQDSEVIRKHMLEHLKNQGLEIDTPATTAGPSKSPPEVSVAQQPAGTISSKSSSIEGGVTKQRTPILVPVTNIEMLLPHHAGKIDMNSPILVPVTDASVIKKLQGFPSSVVSSMHLSLGTSILSDQVGKISSTGLLVAPPLSQQTVTSSLPVIATTPSRLSFAQDQRIISQSSSISNLEVLTNDNLKVFPVAAPLLSTNKSEVHASKSSTPGLITVSSGSSLPLGVSKVVVPATMQSLRAMSISNVTTVPTSVLPAFKLSQIPVPRLNAPTSPPKLPPEFKVVDGLNNLKRFEMASIASNTRKAEDKVVTLSQNVMNIQQLIAQQEKIAKQVGVSTTGNLDSLDTMSKSSGRNVVIYVEPVKSKEMPGKVTSSAQFTHDTNAGRFKCTLCGYTCEHQRTIKAHIWKHSGNKLIDYPMFQNGPLSVYDDENVEMRVNSEGIVEVKQTNQDAGMEFGSSEKVPTSSEVPTSKMPPFIVYEQTKISQVAPALAHLIAARTMVGMKRKEDENETVGEKDNKTDEMSVGSETNLMEEEVLTSSPASDVMTIDETENTAETYDANSKTTALNEKDQACKNVVVESVNADTSHDVTYTGMQSQQCSPRISVRSPDSGMCELTSSTRTIEDVTSTISGASTSKSSCESDKLAQDEPERGQKRPLTQHEQQETTEDGDVSSSKRVKVLQAHEDSAVTLLSLLKKGPNFNPACPPQTSQKSSAAPLVVDYSNASSPGHEDSNSMGESEVGGSKPKSGISTSLLAVIEQLRERSKSDLEEDKPMPQASTKKPAKRRSRKSSHEDNTPVSGIENVEEFDIDGETKFRCKLCHYTNESTMLLRQHMRLHIPKQDFQCSLCNLIADSSESLQDHMIQHCKVRTYQCKLCTAVFNYKSQLRAHMRMHNDHDILLCDFCDFESRNLAAMKLHTKGHLTKPPYKCEGCLEEFITSNSFREHKREGCTANIDKNKTSFKCDECDFVFFGRREMKNHLRLHMGKNTNRSLKRCPYCEHFEPSIEHIQKHIADVHGESKPLKCDMCGFFAVSIRSLKSHMKRHVNDQRFVAQPLEQYKCNLCGYVCHHLPSLKSHMWRHAPDQHYSYEFTNDVINAAIDFDGQTDVTETKQIHVDEFKYLIYEKMKAKGLEHTHGTLDESAVACCWVTFRCCQCGFETINKAELNMHMSAHSDVIKMTLEINDQNNVLVENQGSEVEVS